MSRAREEGKIADEREDTKICCRAVCPFYAPAERGEPIEYWIRHPNLEFTKDDGPLASTPYFIIARIYRFAT